MSQKTYRDGSAQCKALGRRVSFRCGINGVVTCRGPDSIKGFYRKCKLKASDDCALSDMVVGMQNAMRTEKIQRADSTMRAGYRIVECRECGTGYEMPDIGVIPVMENCPACPKPKETPE